MSSIERLLPRWLALAVAGYLVAPWYALQDSIFGVAWLAHFFDRNHAPAVVQALRFGRGWLWPIGALVACAFGLLAPRWRRRARANVALLIGGLGLVYLAAQGFAIDPRGFAYAAFAGWLGPLAQGQPGMGLGGALTAAAFAMIFALGLAERGAFNGEAFIAGSVVAIGVLLATFTFFPVARILVQAFADPAGVLSLPAFVTRLVTERIWGIGCLTARLQCGIAWNTLTLALLCATLSTGLGLAFALIVTRTGFPLRRSLRVLSVLPVITPPFVIGLGLILLFGRSGFVNDVLAWAFHIEPTRWIYGLKGVLLAQVFAFTPIAFLVLIGVVEGVAPSMEEAAQTLRADRWRTFVDVSLPLMRPGLANAFLITFIESIADFGNPLVLGGNFGVLSTEVFYSVVGAQLDPGRAATLGILLLLFALAAFFLQRRALAGRAYTALTGKGDAGLRTPLPTAVRRLCYAVALPWALLTITIYAMTFAGGFVELWGRDYTPTLRHYAKAFGLEWGAHGLAWVGAAWSSFWTTLTLSAIAAPLTAALGILAAYLLTRQRFVGQSLFEYGTMLSFAIPGSVIGVS
jgi:iron(III) transport system permease protein